MQLNNAFLHRKSFVTETRLHALEPFSAVPVVLSHESLWVDSALIPGGEGGDLSGLLADEELVSLFRDAQAHKVQDLAWVSPKGALPTRVFAIQGSRGREDYEYWEEWGGGWCGHGECEAE